VFRMVPVVLLLAGAVAGCGAAQQAVATEQLAAAPVLSNSAAADVVAAYDRGNNEINAALNATGLAGIETQPLRTGSEVWLRITKARGQSVPLITSSDPRFIVPSGAQWFVATTNRVRGGVPSPRPVYTLYTRSDNGPRLAAYSLTPMDDVPAPAVNAASAATAVTDFADLLVAPEALSKAVLNHYTAGLAGKDDFARSTALDEQLANGFAVGQDVLRGKGRTLQRTLDSATHPIYAVRTADGGVLAFTAATVVDVIRATSGGAVTFEADSNEAALLGGPRSANQFRVTRLQTYLTYIPTKASGAQAKVLAFSDTPITVR
jgi:hypothetical protein